MTILATRCLYIYIYIYIYINVYTPRHNLFLKSIDTYSSMMNDIILATRCLYIYIYIWVCIDGVKISD